MANLSDIMEIMRGLYKNRLHWYDLGIDPLQVYPNSLALHRGDFLKQLCKGQFRIQNIVYTGQVKQAYGDNEGPI